MGPQHGIIGSDAGYGLDLPDTAQEAQSRDQAELVQKARFSRTAEYKEIKAWVEARIEYYRLFQPGADGRDLPLRDLPNEERGWRCLASDLMIHEYRSFLAQYEQAAEALKNANKKAA